MAKWQTQQTQNLPERKFRVGSTPTSGTKPRLTIDGWVGSTPTSGTTPRLTIDGWVGSTPTSGTTPSECGSLLPPFQSSKKAAPRRRTPKASRMTTL